jgi:hypothetical protein|tara:strand:+ start:1112 stop:1288 length:177 start_codon:yes stop_codon:yes gene_type:complete
LQNPIKDQELVHVLDVTSIGVLLGSLANILPHVAAIFTIVWTCIRIYETKTVQKWLNK